MNTPKISFGTKLDIPTLKIAKKAIEASFVQNDVLPDNFIKIWDDIAEADGEIFMRKRNNIEQFYFFCDKIKSPRLFYATHSSLNAQDKLSQIHKSFIKTIEDINLKNNKA